MLLIFLVLLFFQTAEFFGYAVATCDLIGDGWVNDCYCKYIEPKEFNLQVRGCGTIVWHRDSSLFLYTLNSPTDQVTLEAVSSTHLSNNQPSFHCQQYPGDLKIKCTPRNTLGGGILHLEARCHGWRALSHLVRFLRCGILITCWRSASYRSPYFSSLHMLGGEWVLSH